MTAIIWLFFFFMTTPWLCLNRLVQRDATLAAYRAGLITTWRGFKSQTDLLKIETDCWFIKMNGINKCTRTHTHSTELMHSAGQKEMRSGRDNEKRLRGLMTVSNTRPARLFPSMCAQTHTHTHTYAQVILMKLHMINLWSVWRHESCRRALHLRITCTFSCQREAEPGGGTQERTWEMEARRKEGKDGERQRQKKGREW